MIISTEQSDNIAKEQATTPLQDELNALRQRKIAKSIVINNNPSSAFSIVDWHEKQRALKEAERKKRDETRKLMQSYKAKESSHFDFQQKELTKEATEDDKNHLKELMEESLDGDAYEKNEANNTVETAVTELEDCPSEDEDQGELNFLKEVKEEEPSERTISEDGKNEGERKKGGENKSNPEEEDILEIEEKIKAEISVSEENDVNKPQTQEMTQEMIEHYQKKALCGCTIL